MNVLSPVGQDTSLRQRLRKLGMRILVFSLFLCFCFSCKEKPKAKESFFDKANIPVSSRDKKTTSLGEEEFLSQREKLVIGWLKGYKSPRSENIIASIVELDTAYLLCKEFYVKEKEVSYFSVTTGSREGFCSFLAKKRRDDVLIIERYSTIMVVKDTVFDVNQDGRLDVVHNSAMAAGCCPKEFSKVYLQKGNGDFTSEYFFWNPTFFSRGSKVLGHSHPSWELTEFYTFIWEVDTGKVTDRVFTDLDTYFFQLGEGEVVAADSSNLIKLKALPSVYEAIR